MFPCPSNRLGLMWVLTDYYLSPSLGDPLHSRNLILVFSHEEGRKPWQGSTFGQTHKLSSRYQLSHLSEFTFLHPLESLSSPPAHICFAILACRLNTSVYPVPGCWPQTKLRLTLASRWAPESVIASFSINVIQRNTS